MRKKLSKVVDAWGTGQDTIGLVRFFAGLALSGVLSGFFRIALGSWPISLVLAGVLWAAVEVALTHRAKRTVPVLDPVPADPAPVEPALPPSPQIEFSVIQEDLVLMVRVMNTGPSREFTVKLTAVTGAAEVTRDLPIELAWDGGERGPRTIHRGDTYRVELFSYWEASAPEALIVGEPFTGPMVRFRKPGQPDPATYEVTATVTVWADGEPTTVDVVAGLMRDDPAQHPKVERGVRRQVLPTTPIIRLAEEEGAGGVVVR